MKNSSCHKPILPLIVTEAITKITIENKSDYFLSARHAKFNPFDTASSYIALNYVFAQNHSGEKSLKEKCLHFKNKKFERLLSGVNLLTEILLLIGTLIGR